MTSKKEAQHRAATEAELAAVVVAWLHNSGAEVYQEVEVPGGIADIVARVGAELWIIETKLSLSLALLVQAMDRRRLAHRVYCAAPRTRTSRDFGGVCKELGVGLLEVYTGNDNSCVKEAVASRRWNRRLRRTFRGAAPPPRHRPARRSTSSRSS